MKKKKIVVMRSCIASLSCLYLMICSSCGNPRNGESKNEDNTKEIEIIIRKSKCSRVSKRKVHFTKRSV